MSTKTDSIEVAIIGGGPIGLELAIALDLAGIDNRVLEAGCLGSTIAWWAPGTTFFSSPERIGIAGAPLESADQSKASRERYLTYLRAVVRQFRPRVETHTRVVDVRGDADAGFELDLQRSAHGVGGPAEERRDARSAPGVDRVVHARRVVLAIGDMHRPRRLGVPGEDLPHVSHYFDDPHVYFGRRVLIVGGKNSAAEAALRLHRIGCEVAISYRGAEFDARRVKYWIKPELDWLVARGRIGFLPRSTVARIDASAVELDDVGDGRATRVPADAVLLLTGYEQSSDLFDRIGVRLDGDERVPRHDAESMETNVSGVYVAGTAAAGSQRRAKLFIENSHVHVDRIVRALGGATPSWSVDATAYASLEES